jgi:hypothetical protein
MAGWRCKKHLSIYNLLILTFKPVIGTSPIIKEEASMSRVVDINSRRLFGEFYPQSPETIPETVSFFGGALATFVAPTAAYCYVTSQIQSLVILAAQILVGLLLAAVMKDPTSSKTATQHNAEAHCAIKAAG